jgi:hypothetical protein
MKIATGKQAYSATRTRIKAQGISFTEPELDAALKQRLPPLLADEEGRSRIRQSLVGIQNTQFESARLQAALNSMVELQNWQVGEAMAEAYLIDHRDCEFPWPSSRDLRNPSASPAGADLVGFHGSGSAVRFAFGEVKTSEEKKWPPQVVTGRHGLVNQLEDLRDSVEIKNHLALIYLGHRAQGAAWHPTWKSASTRYLRNPGDVSLFGVLVRDVQPKEEDVKPRMDRLANGCPSDTSIELLAFYLPDGSIKSLGNRAAKDRSK